MKFWLNGGMAVLILFSCNSHPATGSGIFGRYGNSSDTVPVKDSLTAKLCRAAINQTLKTVTYDPTYRLLSYPNGDVPDSLGVCTDVIIRAYRQIGYDFQRLIHEDIKRAMPQYRKRRPIERADPNIDHRRCPNIQSFLDRHGIALPISDSAADYRPGDIVFWDIAAGHVGLVVNHLAPGSKSRFMVVHNIGAGPKTEDFLFKSRITGHYRYTPWVRR